MGPTVFLRRPRRTAEASALTLVIRPIKCPTFQTTMEEWAYPSTSQSTNKIGTLHLLQAKTNVTCVMENQSEDDVHRQESQQARKQLQLLKRRRKPKHVRSHALVDANRNRGEDEEKNRQRCEEPLREKKPLDSLVRSFEYKSSSTSSQLVPAALHYGEQHQPSKRPGPKIKPTVIWSCSMCDRECIPVREQSRCLCGHRLKDHPMKQLANGKTSSKCCNGKCQCPRFFFVVAEGAWVLRCSCKHKHTDHDPKTHKCSRGSCACNKFFSPWVCNCDHPWSAHEQRTEYRRVKTLEEMVQELAVGGDDVKRTDLHAEPLQM